MAIKTVRIWPDPILVRPTQPVAEVDDAVRALIADLFDTMYAEDGIGLAANQIGVAQQVLVLDLDPTLRAGQDEAWAQSLAGWGWRGPLALINPVLTHTEGEIVWDEGCLSVPGVTDQVRRADKVRCEAKDREGKAVVIEASGLFAVAIQHEMDHLAGRVFVDYLSRLKREVIRKKMRNLVREGPAAEHLARRRTPQEM